MLTLRNGRCIGALAWWFTCLFPVLLVAQAKETTAQADPTYQSYLAHIAAANAALRLNEAGEAKRWLHQSPGDHQEWEWRLLDALSDSSVQQQSTDDWLPIRVEYSPTGDRLCVAASDGFVRVYDATSLSPVREFKVGEQAVYAARFHPDGTRLATCNRDGKIAMWSLESGEQLWEQVDGGQGLADVAFHPDGETLAFCSWYRGVDGVLGIVSTWNTATGEKQWQTEFGVKPIVSVRYSRDGSRLAVGTWDALVAIWEATSLGDPRVLDFRDVADYSAIDDIRWNSDGTRIVAASKNGSPRVWNLETNQVAKDLRGHDSAVFAIELVQNDRWLLSGGSDGAIAAWNLDTGGLLHRWLGHESRISALALHPDGKTFASTSADGTIRIWSLNSMHQFTAPEQPNYVYGFALSGDGQVLAAGGSAPESVTVWDTFTGELLRSFPGVSGSINYLDFGPDRLLVGGNWVGDVIIWDAGTGSEVRRLEAADQGGLMQCSFSGDGQWVAATTNKKQVAIWNARNGSLVQTIPLPKSCWGIDFAPNSDFLAIGDGAGTVHVFAVGTWEPRMSLSGGAAQVNAVRYAPDGSMLAAGCDDGRLLVFDAARSEVRFATNAHSERIWSVDFSRDGQRLATGGADQKVRIWDPVRGTPIVTLADFPNAIYNVVFQDANDDLLINATRSQNALRVPTPAAR